MFGVTKATGIIGHWPLNGEYVVGTTARDKSRNKNDGVITVGAGGLTTGIHGEDDGAYLFDGSDTKSMHGNILNMGLSDWTISAWIKATSGDFCAIVSKEVSGGATRLYFGLYPSRLQIWLKIGGITYCEGSFGSTSFTDGIWHHVATTIDRDGLAIGYGDGVALGTTYDISAGAAAIFYDANSLGIGVRVNGLGGYYTGSMYDVLIRSYAMSAGQVAKLYESYGV